MKIGKTNSAHSSKFSRLILKKSGVRMGRGRGGYTEKQVWYKDSGGHKVTDPGAIFVGERYIDQGYETVFVQEHDGQRNFDLTIKTSDDRTIIKNIEVKRSTSPKGSQMAKNIERGFDQVKESGTVAIYLPNHKNCDSGREFARKGYEEAKRKGNVKGPVEVWFSDKTKIEFKYKSK